MSKEANGSIDEVIDALSTRVLELHARCDALSALVLLLAQKQGAKPEEVQKTLEKVRATSLQKRLEGIEKGHPGWAATLDDRDQDEIGLVDLNLLSHLHSKGKRKSS